MTINAHLIIEFTSIKELQIKVSGFYSHYIYLSGVRYKTTLIYSLSIDKLSLGIGYLAVCLVLTSE